MFNARVRVGFGRGLFYQLWMLCEVISRQRVSSGYVYKRCFVLFDCRVRLKTVMEKAVFQVMVCLNIRKDSVAETSPFPWELKQAARIAPSTSKFFLTAGSRIEEFRNVILRYVTS